MLLLGDARTWCVGVKVGLVRARRADRRVGRG